MPVFAVTSDISPMLEQAMPPVWRLSDIAPAFQSPDPDAPPPSLLRVTVYCVLSCHLNRAIIGQIEKTDKYGYKETIDKCV